MEKIDNDEGSLGQDNITIRYNSTHKHTDTYVMRYTYQITSWVWKYAYVSTACICLLV